MQKGVLLFLQEIGYKKANDGSQLLNKMILAKSVSHATKHKESILFKMEKKLDLHML
jgi:hypothetical protein